MAEKITLAAEPRTALRKETRHLRRAGKTPIVIYGRRSEPVALQVETRDLLHVLAKAGGNHVIVVNVAGEKQPRMALAKEVQRHITRLTPLHADFVQVEMDVAVTVEVPIVLQGECDLVRSGEAFVQFAADRVLVEALPGDLPDVVHVDVSQLVDMHDAVRAMDLDIGTKARLITDPETMIVHLGSTAASAAAAAAMEAAAEEAVGLEGEAAAGEAAAADAGGD
jgi:large subunit ribosomal protein L25